MPRTKSLTVFVYLFFTVRFDFTEPHTESTIHRTVCTTFGLSKTASHHPARGAHRTPYFRRILNIMTCTLFWFHCPLYTLLVSGYRLVLLCYRTRYAGMSLGFKGLCCCVLVLGTLAGHLLVTWIFIFAVSFFVFFVFYLFLCRSFK